MSDRSTGLRDALTRRFVRKTTLSYALLILLLISVVALGAVILAAQLRAL